MDQPLKPAAETWRFKMLYDGECPLCRREIRWLQRINRRGALAFEDISAPRFNAAAYNKTQEELMSIIHGVLPDGSLVTKMDVFREAYCAVGLGWLIAPTRWPVLKQLFDLVYAAFARWRIPLGKMLGRGCEDVCYRKPVV